MDMDLLILRDRIREMLAHDGAEITGCGFSFFDKVGDISFKLGESHYWLALREIKPKPKTDED